MPNLPVQIIGELINHSFARARRGWKNKDLTAYQNLAKRQCDLGVDYLSLNIDGTQNIQISLDEMLDFLPTLVPAIQEVCSTPIAFDNPSLEYHKVALSHYDANKSGPAMINSVAASRSELDEMIKLVAKHDTKVVVMAFEKFTPEGSNRCMCAKDVHETAKTFVKMLEQKAGCSKDQIIIDPGLVPVIADAHGLVNMSLDAMKLISLDSDLADIHLSVGLTNLSYGVPKEVRENLESAYLTLACKNGLDSVLANPEKNLRLLDANDPTLMVLQQALTLGRPQEDESGRDAGIRQADHIKKLL